MMANSNGNGVLTSSSTSSTATATASFDVNGNKEAGMNGPVKGATSNNNDNELQQLQFQFLYKDGFMTGLFSDIRISVILAGGSNGFSYNLHKLILWGSQSTSIFKFLISNNNDNIQLMVPSPIASTGSITRKSLDQVIGSLYGNPLTELTANKLGESTVSELASTLATSMLLHLTSLSQQVASLLKESVSPGSCIDLVSILPYFRDCINLYGNNASSAAALADSKEELLDLVQDVSDAIFTYLNNSLFPALAAQHASHPSLMWSQKSGSRAYGEAVEVFGRLPFVWIKGVLESEFFGCPTDLDRFEFARDVLDLRRKRRAPIDGGLLVGEGEENVLLSFGHGGAPANNGTQGGHGVVLVRTKRPAVVAKQDVYQNTNAVKETFGALSLNGSGGDQNGAHQQGGGGGGRKVWKAGKK